MPNITGQRLTADGFVIDTVKYGPFQVVITKNGNQTTVRVTQNGAVVTEPTINNATPAVVESVINNAINGVVLGVGGTQDFYSAVHIFTLSPLSLIMASSDTPISGTWWVL